VDKRLDGHVGKLPNQLLLAANQRPESVRIEIRLGGGGVDRGRFEGPKRVGYVRLSGSLDKNTGASGAVKNRGF